MAIGGAWRPTGTNRGKTNNPQMAPQPAARYTADEEIAIIHPAVAMKRPADKNAVGVTKIRRLQRGSRQKPKIQAATAKPNP